MTCFDRSGKLRIMFILLGLGIAMNGDFKAQQKHTRLPGMIERPAFSGKQSIESQYAELQDRWQEIKSRK